MSNREIIAKEWLADLCSQSNENEWRKGSNGWEKIQILRDYLGMNQQAPSATVDENRNITGASEEYNAILSIVNKLKLAKTNDDAYDHPSIAYEIVKYLHSQQPTVDEKWYTKVQMYEYLLGKNYDKSIAEELAEDYANNLEKAYHKGRLHSQQPTVDDPYMKNFGVSSQQPTVDVDSLWRKHSVHIDNENQLMKYHHFEKALTEALRGSYTREDMIAFVHHCVDWNINNGKQKEYCRWWDVRDDVERTTEQLLIQYDTERGMKNG